MEVSGRQFRILNCAARAAGEVTVGREQGIAFMAKRRSHSRLCGSDERTVAFTEERLSESDMLNPIALMLFVALVVHGFLNVYDALAIA